MSKTLIVGGAGYLGGALTDLLDDVVVYDSLLFEEDYRKNVFFERGDIQDHKKLKKWLKWADTVVWLAAIVGDGACALNPALTKEINQDSVKWLSENFDGRIIFMSTCSVYGANDDFLDEKSATNPLSVYAATKLEAEKYLKNKNAIIFRLGTLFGLGDAFSRIRLDLVVNTLTARAISEGKLTVFGGEQYRPLLHVKDAAQVIVDNLKTKHTGVYNLSWGNIKIADLAQCVQDVFPCEIEYVDTTFEDTRNYKVEAQKAMDAFDFDPALTPTDGIKEVGLVLGQGRIKDLNNPRYSNAGFLGGIHASN